MRYADVALALSAAEPGARRVCHSLFPAAEHVTLTREQLRPHVPFSGVLFDLLRRLAPGSRVGLVVPVRRTRPGFGEGAAGPPPGALLRVRDHVNLELRGPLTGRWPAGVPRDFPKVAGVYQPAGVRASGGPRVYSSGVVVAGVADARRLTPFEAEVVREQRIVAVSDTLVPAAITAAYYGLTLAACGVPPADDNDEQ